MSSSLEKRLEDILKPLTTYRGELEESLAAVDARRDELREELRRVDRILSPVKKEETPKRRRAASSSSSESSSKRATPAAWRIDSVAELLGKDPSRHWTAAQIADELDWNLSSTTAAVAHAREQGRIRLVGTAPTPGSPYLYGSVPAADAPTGNGSQQASGEGIESASAHVEA